MIMAGLLVELRCMSDIVSRNFELSADNDLNAFRVL